MTTRYYEYDSAEAFTELMESRQTRRTVRRRRRRGTRGANKQQIGRRGGIHLRGSKSAVLVNSAPLF